MILKLYSFITLLGITRSNLLPVETINNDFEIFVKNLILKQSKSAEFVGVFYDEEATREFNVQKILGDCYVPMILHDLITPEILFNGSEGWIPMPRKKVTEYNVMVIEKVDGLSRMLEVADKIPFFSARTNVLIIVIKKVDGEDSWIRDVFSKLWKIYILNVGLVFYTGTVNVFTYNPWIKPLELKNLSDQGTGVNIFYDKLKNLHKYPVKILQRGNNVKMINFTENNSTIYMGVDGMTMRTILELYNATSDMIIPNSITTMSCRFISYNWTIYGINGADAFNETIDFCPFSMRLPKNLRRPTELAIIRSNNDVSFNSKALRMDLDYRVDTSYTQEGDSLCIMIPAGGTIPQVFNLLFPLNIHMWIAIVINFIVQSLIYFLIKYLNGYNGSIFSASFTLCRIQLCNGRPSAEQTRRSEKYYSFCFVVYTFLITAAYQSVLISFITVPSYKLSMDRIDELEGVDLRLYARRGIVIDMHSLADNLTYNKLIEKIEFFEPNNQLKFDIKSGYILEQSMAQYVIQRSDFIDSYGRHLFHVMKECPIQMYMGYQMPRGSPFLDILNRFAFRRVESGLAKKWRADGLHYLYSQTPKNNEYEEKVVILTMGHLQGAFCILCIGHVIAAIAFLIELYWK